MWNTCKEISFVCYDMGIHIYAAVSIEYVHECRGFESQLIFQGKVTALGVLCCFALFVCLTLLAPFFLPSHLSFNMSVIGASVSEPSLVDSTDRTR